MMYRVMGCVFGLVAALTILLRLSALSDSKHVDVSRVVTMMVIASLALGASILCFVSAPKSSHARSATGDASSGGVFAGGSGGHDGHNDGDGGSGGDGSGGDGGGGGGRGGD